MTTYRPFLAHRVAYWKCNILHCDMSPNNVLLTSSECFGGGLLIDWDLCKQVDSDPSSGAARQANHTVRYLNFPTYVS